MKTICLAMIVKNESKVIARCLKAAKPFIDSYCIADTGSTDDTIEIIEKEMKGIEGKILPNTWKNFGYNRTEVFDAIREQCLADTALVLDADDVIEGAKPLLPDGYDVGDIMIRSGTLDYYQRRVFDMRHQWKYVGAVHEYPTVDGVELKSCVAKNTVIVHKSDGASWKDEKMKYLDHAQIFERELKLSETDKERNQFYLAQSLRSAEQYYSAVIEYTKRAAMKTGWYQEAVYSQLMIARIEQSLGNTERATLEYMKCYEMDPTRNEALYELTKMMRIAGNYHLGSVFGKLALQNAIPKITDKLFMERSAWEAGMLLEAGLCEWYTGNKKRAAKLWKAALRMNPHEHIKKALLENLKFVPS